MRRDPRSYLWDVPECPKAVAEFTQGKAFDDYLADHMLRSAVERQFEIIGEALSQFSNVAPNLARRIPELPQVVAFRNILIHGYATVNHATVWRTVHEDIPQLRESAAQLLNEPGNEP